MRNEGKICWNKHFLWKPTNIGHWWSKKLINGCLCMILKVISTERYVASSINSIKCGSSIGRHGGHVDCYKVSSKWRCSHQLGFLQISFSLLHTILKFCTIKQLFKLVSFNLRKLVSFCLVPWLLSHQNFKAQRSNVALCGAIFDYFTFSFSYVR